MSIDFAAAIFRHSMVILLSTKPWSVTICMWQRNSPSIGWRRQIWPHGGKSPHQPGKTDACSETMLTEESSFTEVPPPRGFESGCPCDGKQTGSPLDQWDMVRMKWDCRLSTGLPPSSRLRRLWSWKGGLQQAWNWDRKAMWDQVGLSHCQNKGLVTVRNEAHLRQGSPQMRPQWSITSGSPM